MGMRWKREARGYAVFQGFRRSGVDVEIELTVQFMPSDEVPMYMSAQSVT